MGVVRFFWDTDLHGLSVCLLQNTNKRVILVSIMLRYKGLRGSHKKTFRVPGAQVIFLMEISLLPFSEASICALLKIM